MRMSMTLRMPIRRGPVLSLVAAAFVLAAAPSANAQRFRGPDKEITKSGDALKGAFKEVVLDANESTVRVRADGKDVAMGTVVSDDGYILTKASELAGGDVTVVFRDGGGEKAAK